MRFSCGAVVVAGMGVFLIEVSCADEIAIGSKGLRFDRRLFGRKRSFEVPRSAVLGISVTDELLADFAPGGSSAKFVVNLDVESPEALPRVILAVEGHEGTARSIASEAAARLGVPIRESADGH